MPAAGRRRRHARDQRIDDPGEYRADDRCHPEQPELTDRIAAHEQRGAGRAGRVHRRVGDRDRDQVDQRQAQADRDRRKAGRHAALVGGAHHEQEEARHHDFANERRTECVVAGRAFAEAVRREAAADDVEARFAGRDQVQHECAERRADHLRDDVRHEVACGEAAGDRQPDAHRRIQVAARNVANCECHRQHGQAEGKCDAGKADAEARKGGGQHGASAPAEHQPERAEYLCSETLRKIHVRTSFKWIEDNRTTRRI